MATAVHFTPASQPGTHQKIIDMAMNALDAGQLHALWALAPTRFYGHQKAQVAVGNLAHTAGSDVIVCAKWTNSGDTSGLNRASAGCFTRMTGLEDGCCARIR